MKIISSIFCLCLFSFSSLAEIIPSKSLPSSNYVIKSDAAKTGVSSMKCHVFGHVKDPMSGLPLSNVIVSTLDRKHDTKTDTAGFYDLMLDVGDTSIFAFKSQFAELVIWNYDFKGGHEVELDFFLTEDWGTLEMDKPVIYLYSDQEMTASLQLNVMGELTFSYPQYNQGWDVSISSSGISSNGREYPYLFWEGESEDLKFPRSNDILQGAFIKTDTLYGFLESSLSSLGLNYTEQTDFITYWAPRMSQEDYAFVSFIEGEAYDEQVATLDIVPKPDAQKRVYMLFSLTDKAEFPIPFESQKLDGFDRKGFTLLEWGGTQLPTNIFNYETLDL